MAVILRRPFKRFNPGLLQPTFWLRADTGVFTTSGGGTPVSANNDPVGLWSDLLTGSTYAFSQSTAGLRCSWIQNGLNGFPTVRSNGSTQFLIGNAASLNFARNVSGSTLYTVVKYGKAGGAENPIFFATATPTFARAGLQGAATNQYRAFGRSADGDALTSQVGGTKSTANFVAHGATLDYAGSPLLLRVNGVQYGPALFPTLQSTPNTASAGVGLLADDDGNNILQGDIAELIGWQRVLTTPECQQVEQYFNLKYTLGF